MCCLPVYSRIYPVNREIITRYNPICMYIKFWLRQMSTPPLISEDFLCSETLWKRNWLQRFTERHLLAQSQQWKQQNNMWNLFNGNDKDTRIMSIATLYYAEKISENVSFLLLLSFFTFTVSVIRPEQELNWI